MHPQYKAILIQGNKNYHILMVTNGLLIDEKIRAIVGANKTIGFRYWEQSVRKELPRKISKEFACGAGKTIISLNEHGMVLPCAPLPADIFNRMHYREYISACSLGDSFSDTCAIQKYADCLKEQGLPLDFCECILE